MAGKTKSLQQLVGVLAVAFLQIGLAPRLPAVAESLPTSVGSQSPNSFTIAQAFNPPDRGAPPRTADGGTRGCGSFEPGAKPLTALTPNKNLALTVTERPSFFFYVPKSPGHTIEFTLFDKDDVQQLYKVAVPAPSASGIVSISLPTTASALKVGQMYHWYAVMVCDPKDRTGDVAIDGWVERTTPTAALTRELQKASRQEHPGIYAKAGIWHEALASLAELRRDYPSDATVATAWKDLLSSVELGQFAEEPLVTQTKTSLK